LNEIEIVLALLVVVAALTPIARKLRVPYPILLVLSGAVLALLPIFPGVPLEPDLVFLLFLPPLIFSAAFNTSVRDFRALLQPIISLAVGLVLVTMFAVALLLHFLMPEISWPAAFAFGAIVSPPDAVAAVAVFRGLGVPRKIVTLLEGESLVNDATALVAYRTAIGAGAVGAAAFSASEATMGFVLVGTGGLLVGIVVARLVGWLQSRLNDPTIEVTLSLLTPFAAYLPAEAIGVSGVLAAVAAGLYLGWRDPYISQSEARLRGRAVWDMVDFLLNGLVFILIGLQLQPVIRSLEGQSLLRLIGQGLLLSLAVIVIRIVWVFATKYGGWMLRRDKGGPAPHWKEMFVAGWAGMRGVVSLAVALALPENWPERPWLIFLTFVVILVTLVGQGLTLPFVVHKLGVAADGAAVAHQGLHARQAAAEAAMERIEQLRVEWPDHRPLIDTLQNQYEHRASHLIHPSENGDGDLDGHSDEAEDQELIEHHVIRRAVIDAQRDALLSLRNRGELADEIWRDLERELDLEELRMDA
jgi:monovalent cation/hydrogen antiporter